MSDERVMPGTTEIYNVNKHIARYNMAMQRCQGKDVLDVASGAGYGTNMLSWVARHVLGVEKDIGAWQYSQLEFHRYNVDFHCEDLTTFIDPEGFDVIVSFETAEHIENLDDWRAMVKRNLRPGGHLIYSVPLNEVPGFNEHHYHSFDLESAKQLYPHGRLVGSAIQKGVNMMDESEYEADEQFTYFLGVVHNG